MPQRTIAPGGGDWNNISTWVEGAIPTSSDFVVGNASSGQLTVNVSATIQYVDFTNYASTLTINNTITLGLSLASSTNTFGSGMSYNFIGAGILQFNAFASTIVQNGTTPIPSVLFNGTVIRTLSTNMYITNFRYGNFPTFNGNTIYVGGDFVTLSTNSIPSASGGIAGTTAFILTGNGIFGAQFSNTLTITGSAVYNTFGASCTLNNGANFTYQDGTTPTLFEIITNVQPSVSQSFTLNVERNGCNLYLGSLAHTNSGKDQTITLGSASLFNTIGIYSIQRAYTSDDTISVYTIQGNSLSANTLSLIPVFRTTSAVTNPPVTGSMTFKGIDLILDRNYTHYFGSMKLSGGAMPTKPVIKSNSTGNQVSINLGSKTTTQIVDYDFTDVNAVGEQIVAINGTLSNTTNITTTYPTGGGAAESSYVFIS